MESAIKSKTKKRKQKQINKDAKKPKLEKSNEVSVTSLEEEKPNDVAITVPAEEIGERYPILKDEELVKRFMTVQMNNNQKGRIRQVLKEQLKGTADTLLPDVVHNRIKILISNSENLSEAELRKLRILFNMLKTATQGEPKTDTKTKKKKKVKSDKKNDKDDDSKDLVKEKDVDKEKMKDVKKETKENKVKGPKRYVVFVGNLPVDIDKEKIIQHFAEMRELIVDVRIPKRDEARNSSIAYVELKNDASYELALSKHHSMLDNKRINVLYTTQKNSKISKTEAKSKSAKLIAMQKSGKLIGSIPLKKKRSHRRMKMKRAQAKAAQND